MQQNKNPTKVQFNANKPSTIYNILLFSIILFLFLPLLLSLPVSLANSASCMCLIPIHTWHCLDCTGTQIWEAAESTHIHGRKPPKKGRTMKERGRRHSAV